MKRELHYLMVGAVGLLGVGWLMNRAMLPRKQHVQCQTNLKQIGIAIMQYGRDYDEKLPPRDKWQTVIMPYQSRHMDPPLKCPVGWHYAMNGHLAGKSLAVVPLPPQTPLTWDAATNQPSAMDNGRLWPVPSRHPEGNNMLFMDGHVAAMTRRPRFAISSTINR